MITDLVLANARITSRGLRFLCDALPFMDNIYYLDLSQNCIDDRGMDYFSELLGEGNLSSCPSLRKVTFLGNRITVEGAKQVAKSAMSGNLEYLKYACSIHDFLFCFIHAHDISVFCLAACVTTKLNSLKWKSCNSMLKRA